MEDRLDRFLDNEWPHMMARLGRVEGAVWFMGAAMLAVVGLLTAILVK